MRTLIVAVAGLLVVCASPIHAADSGSRTYADPSCSDRNANSENCLVQDGPSRRGTAGTPPGTQDTSTPASKAPSAAAGKGVAAGGTNSSGSGTAGR